MKAYHNDPSIKRKYLARVSAHEKADEIVKGKYWENGKGCAVGCTIHSSNHSSYETELGIPLILAQLEDNIFESLPNNLAKTWPRRFLAAIKPGSDLSLVWPKLAVWILSDETFGTLQYAKSESSRNSILMVSDLYLAQVNGLVVPQEDWQSARADADAAAYAAAYAADAYADAYADAADAADAAADAAAYAAADAAAYAADAADAAADAYAYAAAADARTKYRIAQSKKLLELLKEAR